MNLPPSSAPRARACPLLLGLAWALAGPVSAQTNASDVAVPFYNPADFIQGLYKDWVGPRAAEFAAGSARLPPAVEALCRSTPAGQAGALQQARKEWQATAQAWDRLSAVAIGPLVQRRSPRQIDFTPTRPELIQRAVKRQPADAAAMETVGTPAKGLPALEWLLWTEPVAPASPECNYAVQVAADIDREAQALARGAAEQQARDWTEEGQEDAAAAAMGETLNQWVGGLERLRWQQIERPVREAGSTGRSAAAFPRLASGQSAASWAAQWQALRRLAILPDNRAPQPGAGLVPLETYLRGRGLNPVADQLRQLVTQSDQAMGQITQVGNPARPEAAKPLLAAAGQLAALKRFTEATLAPALQVNLGFSDADGD